MSILPHSLFLTSVQDTTRAVVEQIQTSRRHLHHGSISPAPAALPKPTGLRIPRARIHRRGDAAKTTTSLPHPSPPMRAPRTSSSLPSCSSSLISSTVPFGPRGDASLTPEVLAPAGPVARAHAGSQGRVGAERITLRSGGVRNRGDEEGGTAPVQREL